MALRKVNEVPTVASSTDAGSIDMIDLHYGSLSISMGEDLHAGKYMYASSAFSLVQNKLMKEVRIYHVERYPAIRNVSAFT